MIIYQIHYYYKMDMNYQFLVLSEPLEVSTLLVKLNQEKIHMGNEKKEALEPILLLIREWKCDYISSCNKILTETTISVVSLSAWPTSSLLASFDIG